MGKRYQDIINEMDMWEFVGLKMEIQRRMSAEYKMRFIGFSAAMTNGAKAEDNKGILRDYEHTLEGRPTDDVSGLA